MSYLKRLPVSELKVDRSFVSGMVADADDAVLLPKQGRASAARDARRGSVLGRRRRDTRRGLLRTLSRWAAVRRVLRGRNRRAVWLITRTVGTPLGPEAGEIEAVGALDTVTAAFEAAIVTCCAWRLITYPPRSSPGRDVARLTTAGHEP